MCLIAIAFHHHRRYPLVIAANRDEFYERPTAALDYWTDQPKILAGRDLEGMGTWLGISTSGRIGAITNFRDPEAMRKKNRGPSRGLLVSEFLSRTEPPRVYLERLRSSKAVYDGFNLLVGNMEELWWYCNVGDRMRALTPGIHAISNHLLNTPWPKVKTIKTELAAILDSDEAPEPEAIFAGLADTGRPPDEELPDTGIDLEWERTLSPVFITSPIYGTRTSSLIFIDRKGHVTFYERTFAVDGSPVLIGETRRFELRIQSEQPGTTG